MQDNTTGSTNTAGGFFAMERNTTGNANTAFGDEALDRNVHRGESRIAQFSR
jgi:hypothetical protein